MQPMCSLVKVVTTYAPDWVDDDQKVHYQQYKTIQYNNRTCHIFLETKHIKYDLK